MQNKKDQRAGKLQMITKWQQSGLTQNAFCITNNIPYHTFHYWYHVYRSNANATASFLRVNITTACQEKITVTGMNGIQVQFAFTDQSVDFVKKLLLP